MATTIPTNPPNDGVRVALAATWLRVDCPRDYRTAVVNADEAEASEIIVSTKAANGDGGAVDASDPRVLLPAVKGAQVMVTLAQGRGGNTATASFFVAALTGTPTITITAHGALLGAS